MRLRYIITESKNYTLHVIQIWLYGGPQFAKIDKMLTCMIYNADKYGRCGQPPNTLEAQVLKNTGYTRDSFYMAAQNRTIGSSGDVSLARPANSQK